MAAMDLSLTHACSAILLAKAATSLKEMMEPLLVLQKWQQSPVVSLMVDFSYLVGLILEAALEKKGPIVGKQIGSDLIHWRFPGKVPQQMVRNMVSVFYKFVTVCLG